MPYLPDGTFAPQYLNISNIDSSANNRNILTSDPFIKFGNIIAVHYPSENTQKQNNSEVNFVTYDVQVDSWNNGVCNYIIINNCRVLDLFGGVADYCRPQFRVKKDLKNFKDEKDPCSRVLVVGVSGNLRDAIIIGGLVHPSSEKDIENGHNFKFEFNGINLSINKDGELTVTRKGATNDDGTIKDEQNGGAKVIFDKDGSITLSSTKENQIYINDVDERIEIGAKDNSSTENLVLGKTYREKQKSLHDDLKSQLDSLQSIMMDVFQYLLSASSALKVPMTGGPASSVFFQQAAQKFMDASMKFSSMKSSIDSFESNGDSYLSKKTFTE